MALPADYISGTITLTNGSPDFTGTGTGWQAADFREGDILLGVEDHAGQVYVIEAITGNAAGTLTQAWAGSSGTYTYRMRYEWDSSRVSAQARAMVELLGNGNLEAEAAIDGTGGDWLSYYTGPGAKARTAFTAKARAILSKENNGDVLAEIGAQPAGEYQPLDGDLTAIAALVTQAFGRSLLTGADASAIWALLGGVVSAGANGYVKLPGGIIIQWGLVTSFGTDGFALVTFPVQFPNVCYGVVHNARAPYDGAGTRTHTSFTDWNGPSASQVGIMCRQQIGSGAVSASGNVFWVAVGR